MLDPGCGESHGPGFVLAPFSLSHCGCHMLDILIFGPYVSFVA